MKTFFETTSEVVSGPVAVWRMAFVIVFVFVMLGVTVPNLSAEL